MNESDLPNNENEKTDEWKSWPPEAFLNILWHELRTQLTAIKAYAGILSNQTNTELHPMTLENLSKSIERIEMVIEGIPAYLHERDSKNSNE